MTTIADLKRQAFDFSNTRLLSLRVPSLLYAGLLAVGAPLSAGAADWRISTFAGTGVAGSTGDGGPATSAQINDPYGVVRGPDGAIWFCEHNGHRVRRIAPDGTITTVVGTGERGHTGDGGPATKATLDLPHEIRFDKEGHLFIADMGNNAVRRVDAKTGIITTIAGGPSLRGYSGDGGPASAAGLKSPHSIQFDGAFNLYICDVGNHVIRIVDRATGRISTFAGTGKPGPTPDGSPIAGTPLNNPRSLDVDRDGNLWLVTREGNQVLKFDVKAGVIRHIAGTGAPGFTGNGGPAKLATLSGPKGIALDAKGNAWLADTESHSVRMIDAASGNLELVVGTGAKGDGPDGDPLKSALNRVHGVFVDKDGSVFIGDSEAHRIRVLRRR
jgi:streptogramin lyase